MTTGRGCLESGLRAVRNGELTFDQFFRSTRARWRQIAEKLFRRWDLPAWVSVEDIEQEILVTCWKFAWRFDFSKSARESVEHFAVWNGLHAAQKVATKARIGARPHRGEGHAVPSRYEIPVSFLGVIREDDDDGFGISTRGPAVEATQERDALRRLILGRLAKKAVGADQLALRALAAHRGHVDEAAVAIYDDEAARRELGLTDVEEAKAVGKARKVVCAAIRRAAGEAA